MATKQELEARVVELEAKLAEVAVPESELVTQLRDELAGRTANALASAEQCDMLKEKVTKLLEENEVLNVLSTKLSQTVDSLSAKNDELTKLCASSITPAVDKCVILSGKNHDIIHAERVKDLVDLHRKHFVEDDDLVLVVKPS